MLNRKNSFNECRVLSLGRHKDPKTIEFIKKLEELGKSLGYLTETEYPMMKGLYFADLVWKFRLDQPPFVTFEIETSETLGVFKNTSKYFDNVSADVPRSYRHFMILLNGALSEGTRKPLQRYINYYNVSLYEDLANDQKAYETLFSELERLSIELSDLVKHYLLAGRIDDTVLQVIRGLQEGLRSGPIEEPRVKIEIESGKKEEERPWKISFKTRTAQGEPTTFQQIADALRTGKPFRIERDKIVELDLHGPWKGVPDFVYVVPDISKGRLFGLECPGASLEILVTPIEMSEMKMVLSNKEEGAPYTFTFRIDLQKQSGTVDISSLDVDKADAVQAVRFLDFLKQATVERKLVILDVAANKKVGECDFAIDMPEKYTALLALLTPLAKIQERTGLRFSVPRQVTKDEWLKINRVADILETGTEEVTMSPTFPVNLTKTQAESLLSRVKNPLRIQNFQAKESDCYESVLGQKVPLGERTIVLPEVELADIKKLEEDVKSQDKVISVTFKLASDKPAKAFYPKWERPALA